MADETFQEEEEEYALEMLTTKQVCERLQISTTTLLRLRRKGVVPHYRLGSFLIRYDPVEVRRAIDRYYRGRRKDG